MSSGYTQGGPVSGAKPSASAEAPCSRDPTQEERKRDSQGTSPSLSFSLNLSGSAPGPAPEGGAKSHARDRSELPSGAATSSAGAGPDLADPSSKGPAHAPSEHQAQGHGDTQAQSPRAAGPGAPGNFQPPSRHTTGATLGAPWSSPRDTTSRPSEAQSAVAQHPSGAMAPPSFASPTLVASPSPMHPAPFSLTDPGLTSPAWGRERVRPGESPLLRNPLLSLPAYPPASPLHKPRNAPLVRPLGAPKSSPQPPLSLGREGPRGGQSVFQQAAAGAPNTGRPAAHLLRPETSGDRSYRAPPVPSPLPFPPPSPAPSAQGQLPPLVRPQPMRPASAQMQLQKKGQGGSTLLHSSSSDPAPFTTHRLMPVPATPPSPAVPQPTQEAPPLTSQAVPHTLGRSQTSPALLQTTSPLLSLPALSSVSGSAPSGRAIPHSLSGHMGHGPGMLPYRMPQEGSANAAMHTSPNPVPPSSTYKTDSSLVTADTFPARANRPPAKAASMEQGAVAACPATAGADTAPSTDRAGQEGGLGATNRVSRALGAEAGEPGASRALERSTGAAGEEGAEVSLPPAAPAPPPSAPAPPPVAAASTPLPAGPAPSPSLHGSLTPGEATATPNPTPTLVLPPFFTSLPYRHSGTPLAKHQRRFLELQRRLQSREEADYQELKADLKAMKAADRSRRAAGAEKRSLDMLLQEGREMQRTQRIGVLAKRSRTSQSPSLSLFAGSASCAASWLRVTSGAPVVHHPDTSGRDAEMRPVLGLSLHPAHPGHSAAGAVQESPVAGSLGEPQGEPSEMGQWLSLGSTVNPEPGASPVNAVGAPGGAGSSGGGTPAVYQAWRVGVNPGVHQASPMLATPGPHTPTPLTPLGNAGVGRGLLGGGTLPRTSPMAGTPAAGAAVGAAHLRLLVLPGGSAQKTPGGGTTRQPLAAQGSAAGVPMSPMAPLRLSPHADTHPLHSTPAGAAAAAGAAIGAPQLLTTALGSAAPAVAGTPQKLLPVVALQGPAQAAPAPASPLELGPPAGDSSTLAQGPLGPVPFQNVCPSASPMQSPPGGAGSRGHPPVSPGLLQLGQPAVHLGGPQGLQLPGPAVGPKATTQGVQPVKVAPSSPGGPFLSLGPSMIETPAKPSTKGGY